MALISISNLRPSGADLFDGSESYLQDLNDNELVETNGGITPSIAAFTAGFVVSVVGNKRGWW
jgi:lactobin A/cerein 7B family class IIb bacteriocin